MAIGNESLVALEQLAARQQRIYSDACDLGLPETPEVRKQIMLAVSGLKKLEGMKINRWVNGVTCTVRCAVEQEDTMVHGYEARVSKFGVRGRGKWYSIDIQRKAWPQGEFLD